MNPQMMEAFRQMQSGQGAGAQPDKPLPDTAEKIQISSLSLLKMLKHGRAGVPMEVCMPKHCSSDCGGIR